MSTKMIRLPEVTSDYLDALSIKTHRSKQELLTEAVYLLIRKELMNQTAQAYEDLRNDPKAWGEYQKELNELEGTLMDGLDEEY
jgi:predicted DNA-binding protein